METTIILSYNNSLDNKSSYKYHDGQERETPILVLLNI